MSKLQVGYFISDRYYQPTRYHARLPEAAKTLCGREATLGPAKVARGAVFGWQGSAVSVKRALRTLTHPHRPGCKTCIKLAPRYDDAITRLGRVAR